MLQEQFTGVFKQKLFTAYFINKNFNDILVSSKLKPILKVIIMN